MKGNRKIIKACGIDEKLVKNREEVKQKNRYSRPHLCGIKLKIKKKKINL